MRQDIPSRLGRKYGQCCRGNFLSKYDLHRVSLDLQRGLILVKTDTFLLAEQVEHPHHRGVGLAFAALVFCDGVGVDAEALCHLVLIDIELLASDEQLFSEGQFWHVFLSASQQVSRASRVLASQLKPCSSRSNATSPADCAHTATASLLLRRPSVRRLRPDRTRRGDRGCLWRCVPWRRERRWCRGSRRSRDARRGRSCLAFLPGRWR